MAKFNIKFEAKSVEGPAYLIVYIPEKLIREGRVQEAKVVYLLHGKNGDGEDFGEYTGCYPYAKEHELILVSSSMSNSYYTDMAYGPKYFELLSSEIPLFLNNTMKLSTDRDKNYVLGFSMGGFGALKLALTYPERFKEVCSISGSLRSMADNERLIKGGQRQDLNLAFGSCNEKMYKANDIYYLLDKLIKNKSTIPYINISCGEQDGLIRFNKAYVEFLEEKKVPHSFLVNPGDHSLSYCDKEMLRFFCKIS
ncbi:alpha/beta hydrolase [Alloiococcus sp. CFN-8]|uniref:alpha/beta hydrolase n=1 Tax=Alloiococcus sp. CFN-8 TaxID=3416081 RepID=UPI003CFA2E3C